MGPFEDFSGFRGLSCNSVVEVNVRNAGYYTERQAEDAMAILASWMGHNNNLRVKYHNGTAVDADIFQGTIRIPRLACASGLTQEALMLLRTRVYHEAGHIDETKLTKREYPKKGVLFEIWNALEDRRMEAALARKHKGCETVFRWSGQHHNKKIAEKLNAGKPAKPLWEALVAMSFLLEGLQPAWNLSEKAQAYVDAAYDEFVKIRQMKSAKETLGLAKRIYDILKDAHQEYKKEHQQSQEKSQEQEQQDGEPQSGETQEVEGEASSQGPRDFDEEEEQEQQEQKESRAKAKEEEEEDESEESKPGEESGDEGDEENEDDSDKSGSDSDEGDEENEDEGEDEDGESKAADSDSDKDEEGEDEDDSDSGSSDSNEDEDEEDGDNSKDADSDHDSDDSHGGESETGKNKNDNDEPKDGEEENPSSDGEEEDEQSDEEIEQEMEDECEGVSKEDIENEELEDYFKNLDPRDTDYLSRRDLDEHLIPDIDDDDKQEYKDRREMVAVMVAAMTRSLEQALRSLARCHKKPYMRQGSIDRKRYVQIAKNLSKEVFYKTRTGMNLDVAVEIIIDESGSMDNYLDVQLLGLAIGEALEAIHIPFEITGTTTSGDHTPPLDEFTRTNPIVYRHYKTFNEKWHTVRSRIVHTGQHNNNIDGEAIEYCAFRLAQRKESRKIVFSLSDGEPCGGQGNDEALAANIIRVCQRSRESGIEVYGFGIGTTAPKRYYGAKYFVYLKDSVSMGPQFVRKFADIVTGGMVHV